MGVELHGQSLFQSLDCGVHGGEDLEETDDGVAQGVLDSNALPQGRRLQLTQDALDEGGIVTTPAAVQERDNLAGGQPLPELGSGGCRQNRQGGPVLEVGKGPQRLRVETPAGPTAACWWVSCSAQIASWCWRASALTARP